MSSERLSNSALPCKLRPGLDLYRLALKVWLQTFETSGRWSWAQFDDCSLVAVAFAFAFCYSCCGSLSDRRASRSTTTALNCNRETLQMDQRYGRYAANIVSLIFN